MSQTVMRTDYPCSQTMKQAKSDSDLRSSDQQSFISAGSGNSFVALETRTVREFEKQIKQTSFYPRKIKI